jgi:hypothetical protein
MNKQDFCESCNQKHTCQEAYRQLGKARGPSVVPKVVAAFLLPMVVFIASLVVFDHVLAKAINAKELQTALGFLLALSVTFVLILITRGVNGRPGKGN